MGYRGSKGSYTLRGGWQWLVDALAPPPTVGRSGHGIEQGRPAGAKRTWIQGSMPLTGGVWAKVTGFWHRRGRDLSKVARNSRDAEAENC